MTTFDSREKAFEDKFAHDEEIMFKVRARRNRLFGEWVAQTLDMPKAEISAYVDSVLAADLEDAGDQYVIRKVRADFEKHGVDMSDHRLEKHLEECMSEAKAQMLTGD
ncbi:DUF1476 domain-containing protein [Eilatimonas milleporae]|uniref:DUF1476 domain-containing protein n=1 Tax=Eilatimonas milleporae TaxID=911205 RepID=A0A3M0C3E4_9PROT|nr:DUF1476 domain-containing protein [Eilatimonas milleporae]RMB04381.1 hypothetical protein BXY39_2642 [Eilatimonas milleporae]